MPAPSELMVATKAVDRLRKEKVSYKVELVKQKERVRKLEEQIKSGAANEDGNAEYVLRQEVRHLITPHSLSCHEIWDGGLFDRNHRADL